MKSLARSLVRDDQGLDVNFLRYINLAYREIARQYIIPRLNAGESVALSAISTTDTQLFYLPYDFCRPLSFTDSNNRSLDVLRSEDARQVGEYNSMGTFVQFYEYRSVSVTPLYDSNANSVTCGIVNRSTTVTASAAAFDNTAAATHTGQWLLPINRNSTTGSSNPEDYAYKISSVTNTTTAVLERPFRGVISASGTVGSLTTGYFEIRPRNTPIIRIWGNASTQPTIYCEYQRIPSKLANDEDIPEEPRLSETLVHKAVLLSGMALRNAFTVKAIESQIASTLATYQTSSEYDKHMIRNIIIGNPRYRSHSMQAFAGMHIGRTYSYNAGRVRY